jgi:hypothetical protein
VNVKAILIAPPDRSLSRDSGIIFVGQARLLAQRDLLIGQLKLLLFRAQRGHRVGVSSVLNAVGLVQELEEGEELAAEFLRLVARESGDAPRAA